MKELQVCFVQYLKEYISILTEGQEEFFISLCDIEEEVLEELDVSELKDYEIIIVGKKDYSEAVRLRNDINVQKIVLLSGEGVKHIDSLKDFNEYSVLSEKREIIWNCLEKVFSIQLGKEVKGFLDVILEQGEISLWELLQYLKKSMDKHGVRGKELNENLPMLGIWKSKEKEVLKKKKIKRLIRFSKYAIMENRLTKAVIDQKIPEQSERIVTNSLAQGNIQKILESTYFEDAQDWLKVAGKMNSVEGGTETGIEPEAWHGFSYEYKLKEHSQKEVYDIEIEWLAERNSEDTDLDWDYYQAWKDKIGIYNESIEYILKEINSLILPESEKKKLVKKVKRFWTSFENAWPGVLEATPMCLNTFCIRAEMYMKEYMELLSVILTEPRIRAAISGMSLVEDIQTLFCEKTPEIIKMPYYHPICVFYYMGIRQMYEVVLRKTYNGKVGALQEKIQAKLIQKIGLQFPVNMLSLAGKGGTKYALDRTTVWQSRRVEFANIDEGLAFSVLDFKVVQKQILDYINKHPYLSVITVALIDISDLEGIEQLADKIRKLSSGDKCNISRVDFLILSSKEESLKKKLSQIWESSEFKEMIHFRFGRNDYKGADGYDIQRIVQEADLLIIADSSTIYQEPRRERVDKESNALLNRLEAFKIEEQLKNYFIKGHSDISVMWATLQQAAESRDEGLWKWTSREIDNKILGYCNDMVDKHTDKEIVALSSNNSILSEIFMPQNMHAYRKKYNGKNITIISLDSCNGEEKLSMDGQAQISYSLNNFYEDELDLSKVSGELFSDVSDIRLKFYYKDKMLQCDCSILAEETETIDEDWYVQYGELICWQISDFFSEKNIFSTYFADLLVNHWFENANSLPAVLMVERMGSGGDIKLHFDVTDEQSEAESVDSLEAITIHEMIRFVMNTEIMDEKNLNYFIERYGEELLDKVLLCDSTYCLLREDELNNLQEIQERIKKR